jgi:hypothetical protein
LKQIRFWSRKLYRRAIQGFAGRFYINPDSDTHKSILVAGTARSGTTWLGDLIASQLPCRIIFEPFNPDLVPEYRDFHYFQYIRPGVENPDFHTFTRKVFTGDIRNRWIDRQNERIRPQYRLIKEIRINLALKWMHDKFPEVPILFMLRHPCAVVSSRMELNWATDRDIEPFLSQPELMTDHLAPYMDLIKNAKTDEEKHAVIWSASNIVPLHQFKPNQVKVVYYENLCTQPEIELPAIFASIGQPYHDTKNDAINRPSQTSRVTSAVVYGANKISAWKKKLSAVQVEKILRVVDAFGLGHVYDDSVSPLNKYAI